MLLAFGFMKVSLLHAVLHCLFASITLTFEIDSTFGLNGSTLKGTIEGS